MRDDAGPIAGLRGLLGRLRFRWRSWRVRAKWRALEEEDGFDAAHGTETTRQLLRANYGATPVRTFRRILAALTGPLDDLVFVDLGSGKGRVLCLASEHPFPRIIGVEHSPELHAAAERNLAEFVRRSGRREDRFELVCADAVAFARDAWPEGDGVLLFLYCPFSTSELDAVCAAVRASSSARGQRLIVAFVNPNPRAVRVLEAWPGLQRVTRFDAADPALAMYESFELFASGEANR